MKKIYIYALAAVAALAGAVSCQEEFSIEPEVEVPVQEEEYQPWFRKVTVNVSGMDEFELTDTKGAITSGGVSAGKWNSGESKVNSWKIGVYDEDGNLFVQKSGTGSLPSDLVMEFPVSGGADVIAVANWPDYSFPQSYTNALAYVFHFTKDNLISNGVPAYAGLHVDDGEVFVNVSLKRLVSKINFKLSNPNFRAFTATEVSLHNVAMDSKSGASDGYVVKDFDYATSSELASINAGTAASDSYTISFICPENLKGTVSSIGSDPKKKVPAYAPEDATYLEVKGHVTNGGFGDGDVSYRFYLGANATTNFNLERNKIYNVTLSINEGNMEGYQDNATWKVDVGDFNYTGWDYWWLDPTTGFTSRTCVIGEHRNAKLFIRMPEYYAARDPQFYLMMGTHSQFEDRFDPSDDDNVRSWLTLDGDYNYFSDEPYYNSVGYFCWMDEYEDPYECLDNYWTCCSKTRMAYSNTLRSSAITNSNVTTSSFNTGSLSNGDLYDYLGEDCCEKLSWKGYYVSNTCSDANKGCYIFDIQATTVTNVSDDVDFGDWAWVLVYYDDDHYFSIPVYVSEDKMAFNVNTQGQYAYVGQKLTATAVNNYGTTTWTVVDGGGYAELLNGTTGVYQTTGTSVDIACKAEGEMQLRCTDGTGKTYTKIIYVKNPVLKTQYRKNYESYRGANNFKSAFTLTLDGTVNTNYAWWYEGLDTSEKIIFSDQNIFNLYNPTSYSDRTTPISSYGSLGADFASGNFGYCLGLYLKEIDHLRNTGLLRTDSAIDNNPYHFRLNSLFSSLENDYSGLAYDYIPGSVCNPLYLCKEELGITHAKFMTGMTCSERTTELPKSLFYNQQACMNPNNVSLVKHNDTNNWYEITSAGSIKVYDEFRGDNNITGCDIEIRITNSRDGSVWSSVNCPTEVVPYCLMGICLRMRSALYDGAEMGHQVIGEINMLSLAPCIYMQDNINNYPYYVYKNGTGQYHELYRKASNIFSWYNSNTFCNDNAKLTKKTGWNYAIIGASVLMTASIFGVVLGAGGFLANSGLTWSNREIYSHSGLNPNGIIIEPYIGREVHEPQKYSDDTWSWSIPTFLPWEETKQGNNINAVGLHAVETYSSSNQYIMVTSDTPLFELFVPTSPTDYSMVGGNVTVKCDGFYGMYIDLGSSTTYSAVVDNSWH